MLTRLRAHWPEYLIEGWALGMFMISAGVVTVLVEHPDYLVRRSIEDPLLRRALIGLGMGLTAIALIYSPWGRRSGAHMNPAVTLSFGRLGRVAPADASWYLLAQFVGGTLGVAAVLALFGERFTTEQVNYVATVPPAGGVGLAFLAEFLISCGLMSVVLLFADRARLMPYTGIAAGVLVALYITFEAPYSGMSMNPARSFASASVAGQWTHLWVYFAAPLAGMLTAAELYRRLVRRRLAACAKLYHADDVRCIHCGFEPAARAGRAQPAGTGGGEPA